MKRRIHSSILRVLQLARISFYRALSTGHCNGKVYKRQPVLIVGDGIVQFETDVTLGYFPSPFFLSGCIYLEARNYGSSISVGEKTFINNNCVLIAEHTSIKIGKRCLVGTNVEMIDSDFHGINVADRHISAREKARPIVIGDDVLVGSNVRIMKGAVIGDGSVIANGSIVAGTIPSHVIAGGNPARVLRSIG